MTTAQIALGVIRHFHEREVEYEDEELANAIGEEIDRRKFSQQIQRGNLAEGEFGGKTFDAVRDESRLRGHLLKTYQLLKGGRWYSDEEIAVYIGCKPATAGARRRDLKKRQFGGYPIEQRRSHNGQWEYRMAL